MISVVSIVLLGFMLGLLGIVTLSSRTATVTATTVPRIVESKW